MTTPNHLSIEARLTEIREAEPILSKNTDIGYIAINLPHGPKIEGFICNVDLATVAEVGALFVPTSLRRNGIGKRLLQSFTVVAKEEGASLLHSEIRNPIALRNRERVFGEDNLKFYADTDYDLLLPMSYEQAAMSLDRYYNSFETMDENSEGFKEGLPVEVDLTQVDVSGWEAPVLHESVQT